MTVWWRVLRAFIRDTRNAIALNRRHSTCYITGDYVPPGARAAHECHEHPDRGPCIRL